MERNSLPPESLDDVYVKAGSLPQVEDLENSWRGVFQILLIVFMFWAAIGAPLPW